MSIETTSLMEDRRLLDLLGKIVEAPPEDREKLLAESPPHLATEIRSLLDAEPLEEGFLAAPTVALDQAKSPPSEAWDEPVIDSYQLLQPLGQGGMGEVFLAEQRSNSRRVALKVLRISPDDLKARSRFRAERHAMQRLDHPNIGKILASGTTDKGLPFFAMELIDGPPITRYCDSHRLSIASRLGLFVEVCRGADHAHGKKLLHRDLKPSNILVTEINGQPVTKIIDFGIAKGLDAALTDGSVGSSETWVGTPAYMSPETLAQSEKIDARSDIFSLGVLLHEILTGHLPWPSRGMTPLMMLYQRMKTSPKSPSSLLAELPQQQIERVADLRQTSREALGESFPQIDKIVMKAIAEAPEERFDSAMAMATHVERLL